MEKLNSKRIEDITFVGSGIATAYALLGILEELKQETPVNPVFIKVIDKYPEFFSGIPYGQRSGNSVLLINALDKFIPEPHRGHLIAWLNRHRDILLQEFRQAGGVKAEKWIEANLPSINANQWDSLFIPRFFFGKYISELVKGQLDEAASLGLIRVSYEVEEVIDVERRDLHFILKTRSGMEFASRSVALSIGSLPTRRIFGTSSLIRENGYMVLNDFYKADLKSNLEEITDFVERRGDNAIHALILGANASGLEALYKFSDEAVLNQGISSFTVLSSQGVMPDSSFDEAGLKLFSPENLLALEGENNISADQIATAAYQDLEIARELSLGAATTVDIISGHVGRLLSRLDRKESKKFACIHGNNIGRMQRCAGSHYTDSLNELIDENRFYHIAGRFSRLVESNSEGKPLALKYRDTLTGKEEIFPKQFHLVINCMGATDFVSEDTPELLKNLIERNLLIPNDSGIGFDVNTDFEASKDLFILGPLLAGNVIDDKPLWHLEHCGRIIWSSSKMAQKWAKKAKLSMFSTN